MAEYIEREKAWRKVNRAKNIEEALNFIDSIPTADVVEVVRCKNCVYANEKGDTCYFGEGRFVTPEHYCGYAERKTEND